MEKRQNKRVICAMSGGVDSSVAAALLKDQGYEVIGIFMKLWSDSSDNASGSVKLWSEKTDPADLSRENICCSVEASTAARAVASKLNIPFYVVDFSQPFREMVVQYYIDEYEAGRTPNPCVICNRDIKGELLLNKMKELSGDFLATGHYCRIKKDKKGYHLWQAKDKVKDQTYFLWTLTQEKLSHFMFPVGSFTKTEVRSLARKYDLPTAERHESQGICFIPDRNIGDFLRRYARNLTAPGPIQTLNGQTIGQHAGLINYTVGQRTGLGLGGPTANYVVRLNRQENALIVGDEKDLYRKKLIASQLNWINKPASNTKNLGARIRHGHPIEKCTLKYLVNQKIQVNFQKAQRAVTPGQSIVFYAGQEVLGGGIIN